MKNKTENSKKSEINRRLDTVRNRSSKLDIRSEKNWKYVSKESQKNHKYRKKNNRCEGQNEKLHITILIGIQTRREGRMQKSNIWE